MRRIQVTQVGPGHAIYSRKSSSDAGGFAEESGIVLADRVAAMRALASRAVFASCHCNQNFCPPSGSDTSKSGESLDRLQPGLT